jgi:hypothetical protein
MLTVLTQRPAFLRTILDKRRKTISGLATCRGQYSGARVCPSSGPHVRDRRANDWRALVTADRLNRRRACFACAVLAIGKSSCSHDDNHSSGCRQIPDASAPLAGNCARLQVLAQNGFGEPGRGVDSGTDRGAVEREPPSESRLMCRLIEIPQSQSVYQSREEWMTNQISCLVGDRRGENWAKATTSMDPMTNLNNTTTMVL